MAVTRLASECPDCGRHLRRKSRRDGSGEFLGCSGYPRCTFIESVDLNVERIEMALKAAHNDVEFLNAWIEQVRAKVVSMACETGMTCAKCSKHLRELEAML